MTKPPVAVPRPVPPNPWSSFQQNPVLAVAGGIVLGVLGLTIGLPLAIMLISTFLLVIGSGAMAAIVAVVSLFG